MAKKDSRPPPSTHGSIVQFNPLHGRNLVRRIGPETRTLFATATSLHCQTVTSHQEDLTTIDGSACTAHMDIQSEFAPKNGRSVHTSDQRGDVGISVRETKADPVVSAGSDAPVTNSSGQRKLPNSCPPPSVLPPGGENQQEGGRKPAQAPTLQVTVPLLH